MRTWLQMAVAVSAWAMATPGQAAPRIEFELSADGQTAAVGGRKWYALLTELNVDGLRIVSADSSAEPKVDVQGAGEQATYTVFGRITSANELVVTGGTFKLRDRERIAQWLEDLRRGRPADGGDPLPFGLNAEQLDEVRRELARPVGFSTAGAPAAEVLNKIADGLAHPLEAEADAGRELAAAEPMAEELSSVSSGTALAYLLRPQGLVFAPQADAKGRIEYRIMLPDENREAWPVGWPSEKRDRELLPGAFELSNVEIDDYKLSDTIEAIAEGLETPVLFDHFSMVRQGIDPAEVKVSLPAARTTYGIALRKVLFKGRLKFDVLVDEAERPFLWITTVKTVGKE